MEMSFLLYFLLKDFSRFNLKGTRTNGKENPKMIAEQIAKLTSLINYKLVHQDDQIIRDYYFDTTDKVLQTQKVALRVREINKTTCLITMKGPSHPNDWGGMERLEIEEPWSQEGLTKVGDKLRDMGFNMLQQHQDFDITHPLNHMKRLGLEVFQDRETNRIVRSVIIEGGKNSPVLAELAIDSVVYHFEDMDINHYEVEIETKVRNSSPAIKSIVETLITKYGSQKLRKWNYSKLATGKAIKKMLSEEGSEGTFDRENNLQPEAYDKLTNYLW